MLFPFTYFTLKLFCFFYIWLLFHLCALSTNFLLFWNVVFCSYCLTLSRYLFSFRSFAYIFSFLLPVELSDLSAVFFLGSSLSVEFLYASGLIVSLIVALYLSVQPHFPSVYYIFFFFCWDSSGEHLFCYWLLLIFIMVRVFANDPGDLGSIPGRVILMTQKMVLDASLLNNQHYKVQIKDKMEQSRERSCALPYHI